MAYKIGLVVASMALFSACSSGNPPPSTPAMARQAKTQTASARVSLAEARCEREERCNDIGSDRKYSSKDDCVARVRADWKGDLNAQECRAGVNQVRLDECLTALRQEECGHPFDTLDRVATCRSGAMCES
jgi:uncharacterized protein DUF6184